MRQIFSHLSIPTRLDPTFHPVLALQPRLERNSYFFFLFETVRLTHRDIEPHRSTLKILQDIHRRHHPTQDEQ